MCLTKAPASRNKAWRPDTCAVATDLVRLADSALAAFVEKLFHEHYQGLCSFVTRYLGSRAIAEEIVQELFLDLWQRLVEAHGAGAPFGNGPQVTRAYLYTAARHRAIDLCRRGQVEQRYVEREVRELVVPERTVHDDVEDAELIVAARRVFAALPARCRQIFALNRQQGLTYPEIASVLGISVKTVEANMTRVLKALRASLGRASIAIVTLSLATFLRGH
jgi:RNA polymerase sigma-70 factor, ECF subfamily